MIIILMSSCAFVALIGDLISAQFKSFTLEAALSDNLTHAMIGGITWFATTFKFSSFSYYQISLCVFLSSIIDIDHFIEMRSLKIQNIQFLTNRPFLHCTTSGISCALFMIFIGYYLSNRYVSYFGWILFTAIFTHHTRDATRRGYWIFPFGHTPPIPYWIYILIISVLPLIMQYLIPLSLQHESINKYHKLINRVNIV